MTLKTNSKRLKIMKAKVYILSLSLMVSLPAWASLYSFGTLNSGSPLGDIPDNNTIGLTETYTVSGLGASISDLTLTVVLQGGLATDLSGYLRLGNTGSSSFFDLTSVIQAGTLSAGSPTTFTFDFGNSGFQSAFNTQDPNQTWTLFFADTVNGDQSTLNGWSLNITAVPEPVNVAMAVFGTIAVVVGGVRWYRQRKSLAAMMD